MKKRLYIFIVLVVLGSFLSGQELNKLLKRSTTDQIMKALEPTIKMDKEEILKETPPPIEEICYDTFILYVSTSHSVEPDEKFRAFYGIPVSFIIWTSSSIDYIHHLKDVTGWGPTPRDALIDMVIKLVEKKVIDPIRLAEKLKSK